MKQYSYESSNNRVIKNTLFLYSRQILIMIVSLYTVRIVLSVLGAEDFGIHNVVAGTVSMLGFLNSAMASASQRFFSFDMGKGDSTALRKTFTITVAIYIGIACMALIILETIGLWFVKTKLVIPAVRYDAAIIVYHFSLLTFIVSILTTPFLSLIIAHEDMRIYAWTSILEALMKLGAVFLLRSLVVDKLALYGVLLFAIALVNGAINITYCRIKYKESRFVRYWDIHLAKTIISFSLWSLFGNLSAVLKSQGTSIVLNIYFGPMVNAAKGIALQVQSAVTSFSTNFVTALRPQIIKLYSSEQSNKMMTLAIRSSKYTAFLLSLFLLPLMLEMESVLGYWLGQVPAYTVNFTRLVLIDALIRSMTEPMMTVIQATGNIKLYQLVVGGTSLLNLPLSWFALYCGASPHAVFFIAIILQVVASALRLIIINRYIEYGIPEFLKSVFLSLVLVLSFASIVPIFVMRTMNPSFWRLLLTVGTCILGLCGSIFLFGMDKKERRLVLAFFNPKSPNFLRISNR